MTILIPLISLAIVAAVAVLMFRAVQKEHRTTIDAYAQLLDKRDREYGTLADRLFYKEHLPPSNIDLSAKYQQREDDERVARAERRAHKDSGVAVGYGPVDKMQNDMIREYRKTHPPPASEALETAIVARQNTGAVA